MDLKKVQSEMKEITSILFNWNYIDTTGGSLSVRYGNEENKFVLSPTHSGFKKWTMDEGLLVLDENLDMMPESTSNIPAHPSAIIHSEVYKLFPDANAVIHAHAPYSLAFACAKQTLKPYTLQSQILGDLPCFESTIPTNNSSTINEKEVNLKSAIVGYKYSLEHFEPLIDQIYNVLGPRSEELKRHGLGFTVYKHGIFVIARNLSEAFDNLIRFERNAQVQILSGKLQEQPEVFI